MIRKATLHDIDSLLAIEQSCFQGDLLSRRSFRHMLTHPSHYLLVAEEKGVIMGYILLWLHARHRFARIYSLAVLPEYRNQKLGKKLLLAIEPYAKKKEGIRLELRKDNPAITLYERLGYQTIGQMPEYYEDGEDAIVMVKYHAE